MSPARLLLLGVLLILSLIGFDRVRAADLSRHAAVAPAWGAAAQVAARLQLADPARHGLPGVVWRLRG
ncbi:MAG TPA: hypothetical protein VER09_07995 [Pseudomonas sp.]|nr:hypothetical protein [Pseudomonas sp.]